MGTSSKDPRPEAAAAESDPAEFDTASVKPLDTDGVAAIAIGTAMFAMALVVTLLFSKSLIERDATWWIWVCVAGFGLGILGTAYVVRRRSVYRAAAESSE